jgi:hypothetical protein
MTLFHLSHKVSDFLFNYFCLKGWCVSEKILPSKVLMLPKKETLAGSPFGLASARPVPSRVLGSSDVGGALKGQTRPIADVSLMRHSQRCAAWGPCQSDRHASREVSPEARYPTFQNLSHQSHCLRRSGYVPSSALRLVTCGKKRRGEVRLIYDCDGDLSKRSSGDTLGLYGHRNSAASHEATSDEEIRGVFVSSSDSSSLSRSTAFVEVSSDP